MAKKSSEKSEPETKKTGSERGRFSRNKGKRGELKVLEKIRALWVNAKRRIQDRGGRSDGPDLEVVSGSDDATLGLDFEVKHRDETALRPAIKDAQANCRPGNLWVAVDWPTNHKNEPLVVMNLDEWIELIRHEREVARKDGFEAGLAHATALRVAEERKAAQERTLLLAVHTAEQGGAG